MVACPAPVILAGIAEYDMHTQCLLDAYFEIVIPGWPQFLSCRHLKKFTSRLNIMSKTARAMTVINIYFQLQKASTAGAHSVPAKFSNYIAHEGSKRISVGEGIPGRSELVSNPVTIT